MKNNHDIYRRKQLRLKSYDYSTNGAYYITICTYNRRNLFGEIINGKVVVNKYGEMIDNCWNDLTCRFNNIILDKFIIMPDHFHGIIIIGNDFSYKKCNGQAQGLPLQMTISQIIGAFKSITTNEFIRLYNSNVTFYKLWQRGFYEHIIRNKYELEQTRKYIINNPFLWDNIHSQ